MGLPALSSWLNLVLGRLTMSAQPTVPICVRAALQQQIERHKRVQWSPRWLSSAKYPIALAFARLNEGVATITYR
jgi:hypothetical protein